MTGDKEDLSLWFPPGVNHRTFTRKKPIRHVVLHWTAGIGDASQVYRTLIKRGYSIHYVTQPDGAERQMADHSTRCSHATILSDTSIGIENVGFGFKRGPKKFRHRKWPYQTFEKYSCVIDGKEKMAVGFTDVQVETIVELVDRLCFEHNLPRIYPSPERVPVDKVRRFAREFSGVLGHFHVHMRRTRWSKNKGSKWDPGTQIFKALGEAGFLEVPIANYF